MIDDLRVLLDRPLELRVARAVLATATAVTIAFALVLGLVGVGCDLGHGSPADPAAAQTTVRPTSAPEISIPPAAPRSPRQDPQDRLGSARRRADREAREHRALQHVPYHQGQLEIELVGASHGRAVLRVSAPTRKRGKRGWRRFLSRFHDTGSTYRPLIVVRRRRP